MKTIALKPSGIPRNELKTACSTCTKRCCDSMPGIVFPHQLKSITVKSITEMLMNGYCLDWWEGDPRNKINDPELSRVLYIRPRIKGIDRVYHPAWGGTCSFLTDKGCKLEYNNRPYECQALIPSLDHDCHTDKKYIPGHNKQQAALAWLPYNEILDEAGRNCLNHERT